MRGADTFTESLFTMRRLEDFVPKSQPLQVDQMFVLSMAAYNLVRMRSLGQIRPQLQ